MHHMFSLRYSIIRPATLPQVRQVLLQQVPSALLQVIVSVVLDQAGGAGVPQKRDCVFCCKLDRRPCEEEHKEVIIKVEIGMQRSSAAFEIFLRVVQPPPLC